MNYEIFIDGESTEQVVVNSKSEELAREVYEQFNGAQGEKLTFKPFDVSVPRMFDNCIFSKSDFTSMR